MAIDKELGEAYSAQVGRLFDGFFKNVLTAADVESELIVGGEKFRAGIDLLNRVFNRAMEVAPK
jgi:hypothetical protein